jgi:hypothetical protein
MVHPATRRIHLFSGSLLILSLGLACLPVSALRAQDTPVPVSTVKVANNQVTLRLINRTGEAIAYEAIGNTPMRSLANNGTVMLQNLPLPTSLSFNYLDLGQPGLSKLLTINVAQTATGAIDVTLRKTMDATASQGYLGIGRKGGVFIY